MTSDVVQGLFLALAVEQTYGHLDRPDLLERNLYGLHGFFRSVESWCGYDPVCCYSKAKPEGIGTFFRRNVYKFLSLAFHLYERIGSVQTLDSQEPSWLLYVGEWFLSDVHQPQHRLWDSVVCCVNRCVTAKGGARDWNASSCDVPVLADRTISCLHSGVTLVSAGFGHFGGFLGCCSDTAGPGGEF